MLLIDGWTGHCPEVVRQATPAGKNVIPKIIPKGTTLITINLGLYYLYYKSGTEEGPYPRPKRLPKI